MAAVGSGQTNSAGAPAGPLLASRRVVSSRPICGFNPVGHSVLLLSLLLHCCCCRGSLVFFPVPTPPTSRLHLVRPRSWAPIPWEIGAGQTVRLEAKRGEVF